MPGLTVKSTQLSGPGGYTTTTPTLKGGAGELKPMGGGTKNAPHRRQVSAFSGGRKGESVQLRGPGTIIPSTADVEW
jgi:hypothetical protein